LSARALGGRPGSCSEALAAVVVRDKRIALRVLDRIHMKIDVEIGPVQMMGLEALHIQDGADGGPSKPRKPVEGQEQLTIVEEEPKAVG
jgi:hypothetical protein